MTMNEDVPLSPYLHEGLDPVPQPKSPVSVLSDAMKEASNLIGDAIDAGREPGRPLSILSNITKEAPLGSLLIAFMLGIAFGRRRAR
jgi:hypothetical protein